MRWAGHVARMGDERKVYTRFWWEILKDRDHSEERHVYGRVGSEWMLGRLAGVGVVMWIQFSRDRDRWRALVNTVMNLRVQATRSYLGFKGLMETEYSSPCVR
jgi:hypothetical protein